MTDSERIARLERLVCELAKALIRKDGMMDGAWGHPPSGQVIHQVASELGAEQGGGRA